MNSDLMGSDLEVSDPRGFARTGGFIPVGFRPRGFQSTMASDLKGSQKQ